MRKSHAVTAVALSVATALLGTTGVAVAADQLRTRTRDRLKDGSCQVAAVQLRTRDRLKDGSCLVAAKQTRTRANDGTGTGPIRDRLKDGSCITV